MKKLAMKIVKKSDQLFICVGMLLSLWPVQVAFSQNQEPKQIDVNELLVKNDYAIQEQQLLKKLKGPFPAAFDQLEFSEFQQLVSKKYQLNLVLDRSASDDHLRPDTRLSFAVKKVTLEQGLMIILARHNATFLVDGGVVRIISKDESADDKFFATRVFNVRPLLKSMDEKGGQTELVDLIQNNIDDSSRRQFVSATAGLLVIKASQRQLMNAENLLSNLQYKSSTSTGKK